MYGKMSAMSPMWTKLEHFIHVVYHNESYHSIIDNELINYCISEVAYSIIFYGSKIWTKLKEHYHAWDTILLAH